MDIQIEKIANLINEQLEEFEKYTATPGEGVTRLPFTKEAKEAADHLVKAMQTLGLKTRIDASGAVIGRLEGEKKETIMLGSHYDSVKNGGAYDGIAGVVCGLETARLFIENHNIPEYSLEVIATNDEEGARFKSGFLSSKAMLGELTVEELKRLKDAEGMSIYEAMNAYGLNPENLYLAKRDFSQIKGFIEIHIEQGRILETLKKEIGIVETIVGIQRYMVTITGEADHAGTTPMNMRIDAMEAASKIIACIGDYAREYKDAVATVGHLKVFPNEINIIAEEVVFSIDIRCTNEKSINEIYQKIALKAKEIAKRHSVNYTIENTITVSPVDMNQSLRSKIEKVCIQRGYQYMTVNSGAGHDSQPLSSKMNTAMIFVPSREGRSHCKEEYTDCRDLAKAVLVAFDVITSME